MKPLILFGDTFLFHKSVLFKALEAARLRWIDGNALTSPREGVLMAWEKRPKLNIRTRFAGLTGDRPLMNEMFDSDKAVIERAHAAVFGYSMGVDPRTHHGEAVRKSRKNARHDGKIVRLPDLAPMESKVYQRLIDNRDGDQVEDIRLCTLRGRPIICYRKRRPVSERFLNTLTSAEIVEPEDMLSGDELNSVRDICAALGLDYGALDILRDRKTEKIYVVDANNTPRGPPRALDGVQSARALDQIGGAFAEFLGS
jgi:hypothetical protein